MLYHLETDEEFAKIKQFINSNPNLPANITSDDILNPENPTKV